MTEEEPNFQEQLNTLAGLLSTCWPLNERHPEDAVPLAHMVLTNPTVAEILLDNRIELIGTMVSALYRRLPTSDV